ncbi:hypothetical protein ACJMK2_032245 [Sinanodonta woodiana]|uniref:BTB domain-containing protein n=1 Tax=Sinanodonta woodiana TaxID=1069815 RepID=A0ABD3X159_SINWO
MSGYNPRPDAIITSVSSTSSPSPSPSPPLIPPMSSNTSKRSHESHSATRSARKPGIKRAVTIGTVGSDISSTEQEIQIMDHYKTNSKMMLEFFKNGQLCDVEIKAGNKCIKCHRTVLACVSMYFRAMFLSEMAESKQSVIIIKDIDEDAMEKLINFAYTSKIKLTVNNVQPILYAASILQIEKVAEASCEFMRIHLHPTNCIGVREFAEQHNRTSLMKVAEDFICENFLEVTKTQEFKTMPYDLFKKIIGSDNLNVNSEVEVHEVVMNWVREDLKNRKEYLAVLMLKVKLPLVPTSYLMENVATDELVRKDFDCRDLVDEAKHYQMCQASLVSEMKITERMRPRKSYAGVIFCVGGRGASGDPFKSIECYDPHKNKWFMTAEMTSKRRHVGVCASNGLLYAVGGHDGEEHLNTAERFDPKTNKWTPILSMGTKRRGLALGCIGGAIYAVGGLDDNTCFTTLERYDHTADSWCYMAPMNMPRGGVGVATLKGQLYAIGGNDGSSSLEKCERYDPYVNKWTQIAVMNKRRAGAGVCVLDGMIYVVGGFDDNSPLDSCEKYDAQKDEWIFFSSMSCCRGGVGLAALGGLIYAVGGHDGYNYLNSVEAYDPLTDSWSPVKGIKESRAGAGMTYFDINPKLLKDCSDADFTAESLAHV